MHKPMGESNILITGLVRNGAHCIEREVAQLLRATVGFRRVQVLLVESDSTDGTVAKLEDMAAGSEHLRFLSLGQLEPRLSRRTERLAHCRNAYVDAVGQDPRYRDVDYVLISDLDGMNDRLDANAIQSCFHIRESWGVLTANQDGPYYDIWALRHPDWSPDDCLRLLARLEPLFGHETARDIAVYARQARISPGGQPIEVQSAFGGLALYTRQALLDGGYEGVDTAGLEICEHVPHHEKIRAAGHAIYVNPRLVNTGWTIHTRNKRTGRIIKNAIKARVRHWREATSAFFRRSAFRSQRLR